MGAGNNEREQSTETFIAVITEKLEQILTEVKNLRNDSNTQREDINDIKLKLNTLENKTVQQQKEIDEQKTKTESARKTAIGALITIGTGIAVAVIKMFIGA